MINPKDAWTFLKRTPMNYSEAIKRFSRYKEYAATYREMSGTFYMQEYYKLYQAIRPHTTVLDLGGFIGDTAIYFAMHPNVKKVISYEADPVTFKAMKWNLDGSPLHHKIEMHHAFVSSSSVHLGKGAQGITLAEILKVVRPPIVIKCDIEGAERDLFDKVDLKGVYAIELEYHNCKDEVRKALATKGFKVRDLDPMLSGGIMYAER